MVDSKAEPPIWPPFAAVHTDDKTSVLGRWTEFSFAVIGERPLGLGFGAVYPIIDGTKLLFFATGYV
jgi:hypothetical protein